MNAVTISTRQFTGSDSRTIIAEDTLGLLADCVQETVFIGIISEARRSLVGRPVFKTGVGGEKLPGWVRFPCASAKTNLIQSDVVQKPVRNSGFFVACCLLVYYNVY